MFERPRVVAADIHFRQNDQCIIGVQLWESTPMVPYVSYNLPLFAPQPEFSK